MRVGNEMVYLEERKCYVFDDSFEHEVKAIYIDVYYIDFIRLGMKEIKLEYC